MRDGFDWVRCAEGGCFRTAHFVITPHFKIKNSTVRDKQTTKKKHTPKTQRLEPPYIPLQPCSGARKLGSETRKLEKTQLRPRPLADTTESPELQTGPGTVIELL